MSNKLSIRFAGERPGKLVAAFFLTFLVMHTSFSPVIYAGDESRHSQIVASPDSPKEDCQEEVTRPYSRYRSAISYYKRLVDSAWEFCGSTLDKARCNLPTLKRASKQAVISPSDPGYYPYPFPSRNTGSLVAIGAGLLWLQQSLANSSQVSGVAILGFLYFFNEYCLLPYGEDSLTRLSDLIEQVGYLVDPKHFAISQTRRLLRYSDKIARGRFRAREREEAARIMALENYILNAMNLGQAAYFRGDYEMAADWAVIALKKFYTFYTELRPLDPNVTEGFKLALKVMIHPDVRTNVEKKVLEVPEMALDADGLFKVLDFLLPTPVNPTEGSQR